MWWTEGSALYAAAVRNHMLILAKLEFYVYFETHHFVSLLLFTVIFICKCYRASGERVQQLQGFGTNHCPNKVLVKNKVTL